MEGMEEKLGSILGNPEMMQKIMTMAQALGASAPQPEKAPEKPRESGPDPAMLQKMMTIVQGSGIDSNQRALLHALDPYLTRERISRLERAMRAAKLANLASSFLGGGNHV